MKNKSSLLLMLAALVGNAQAVDSLSGNVQAVEYVNNLENRIKRFSLGYYEELKEATGSIEDRNTLKLIRNLMLEIRHLDSLYRDVQKRYLTFLKKLNFCKSDSNDPILRNLIGALEEAEEAKRKLAEVMPDTPPLWFASNEPKVKHYLNKYLDWVQENQKTALKTAIEDLPYEQRIQKGFSDIICYELPDHSDDFRQAIMELIGAKHGKLLNQNLD